MSWAATEFESIDLGVPLVGRIRGEIGGATVCGCRKPWRRSTSGQKMASIFAGCANRISTQKTILSATIPEASVVLHSVWNLSGC